MRISSLLIAVAVLLIACSQSDKKVTAPQKERVEPKYFLIRDGLYKDSAGNLFFKVIDRSDSLPKDRFLQSVWATNRDTLKNSQLPLFKLVDTLSWNHVRGCYYHDKNHWYVHAEMMDGGTLSVIESADYKSFRVINDFYAKDKHYAFYMGYTIHSADIKSFKDFSPPGDEVHRYAKDKNNHYFCGEKMSAEEIKELLKKE